MLPARFVWKMMMERFIRILTTIFWVAAPVFVALVALSGLNYGLLVGMLGDWGLRLVFGMLVSVALICSGTIAWYEFRANPLEEAEYGEWTGKMLFWAIVFGITLFVSIFFIPAMVFTA